MSLNTEVENFDPAHALELEQLLAYGQAHSCAALINLDSGAVLSRGGGNETQKPIDDKILAAFGHTVFAPERASKTERDQVRELCSRLGGVVSMVILMPASNLFLARLPQSSHILSLVIRHSESIASASETAMRAQTVYFKLAPRKTAETELAVEDEVARGFSNWKLHRSTASTRSPVSASPPGRPKEESRVRLLQAVGNDEQIIAGDLFDLKTGAHLDHYRHPRLGGSEVPDAGTTTKALADLFGGSVDVRLILQHFGFGGTPYGKVRIQVGDRDFYWLRIPFFPALRIPFDVATVLLLYKAPRMNPALDWTVLDKAGLNLLRLRIGKLLIGGMKTEMFPFPRDQIEFEGLIGRLADLPKDDLIGRLDVGGFAAHSVEINSVSQRCQECIYYLPHRKWCDLPALPVPVEPGWWCRLWKI